MKAKLPPFLIGIIAFSLVLTIFNLHTHLKPPQVLGAKDQANEELIFWEGIVSKYPTYQDGWLMISQIAKQKGNESLAKGAHETAKSIKLIGF